MKKYRERFYELSQFLGGYFHFDWDACFDWHGQSPTFELVVRHAKMEDSPQGIQKTIDELQEFLSLPLSDEEFQEIVTHEFGAVYTPHSRGMNDRQFLEKILEILKQPHEPMSPIKRVI
jgi:hypothetical protein